MQQPEKIKKLKEARQLYSNCLLELSNDKSWERALVKMSENAYKTFFGRINAILGLIESLDCMKTTKIMQFLERFHCMRDSSNCRCDYHEALAELAALREAAARNSK